MLLIKTGQFYSHASQSFRPWSSSKNWVVLHLFARLSFWEVTQWNRSSLRFMVILISLLLRPVDFCIYASKCSWNWIVFSTWFSTRQIGELNKLKILFLMELALYNFNSSGYLKWVWANNWQKSYLVYRTLDKRYCFQLHFQKYWFSLPRLVWTILYLLGNLFGLFVRTLTSCFTIVLVIYRLDLESKIPDTLELSFFHCRPEEREAALLCLLKHVVKPESMTVIFAATKHHVEYLHAVININ